MTDQRPHPAKFTDSILTKIAEMILAESAIPIDAFVFDPFGGTGKVFRLQEWFPDFRIVALEIEPHWASHDPRIAVGNALNNEFADDTFDLIVTSPTYGNRMADSFNASTPSGRNTYTHKYGEPLSPDNSGTLQWGKKYREFHVRAWIETVRALKTGGFFFLNIKDHIRSGVRQNVTAWHVNALESLGMNVVHIQNVKVTGNGFGQNGQVRVPSESVILLKKVSK